MVLSALQPIRQKLLDLSPGGGGELGGHSQQAPPFPEGLLVPEEEPAFPAHSLQAAKPSLGFSWHLPSTAAGIHLG